MSLAFFGELVREYHFYLLCFGMVFTGYADYIPPAS